MAGEKTIKICDLIINYGILAIIFFVPLIIDFTVSSYNIVDLYKAVFFRAVLSLILLSYIAKIFIAGKLSYRGHGMIFLLAGLMLISFFASSLVSLNPNQSFWGGWLRQQGFYNFFNYVIFFFLLILNLKNFKQIKRIIIAVMAAAVLASFYGLSQYFGFDPLYWSEDAITTGRIFSTLGQPNFFGHWLIMVLPFSLYALIFMAKKTLTRFLVGLIILMQLTCLIFTYSRAAWLGWLGSMAFLIIFWLFYKRFKKVALGFICLILIVAASIISLNLIRPAEPTDLNSIDLIGRLKSVIDLQSGSNKMRLYYLESAVKEIKQAGYLRLLLGYGPETLTGVFMKHYQRDWGVYEAINTVPDRAHNWLFDQILALGLLGLTATLAFYFYLIYKAAKFLLNQGRLEPGGWLLIFLLASLAGYFINNLFSFSLFTNLVYLFLILALGWFIINQRAEEKTIKVQLTMFSKLFIGVSLSAVLAVFVYTNNINQVRAEIYYVRALKSIRAADCRAGVNNMEKVLSLSPNSDYYQENYIFLNLNCLILIKNKFIQREMSRNLLAFIESLKDKQAYGMLDYTARAYTLLGDYLDQSYYDKAEKIFNDLILNYPHIFTAYEYLGKLKMAQGDYAAAADYFKQAIEVLPLLDHPYLNNQHRRQIEVELTRLYGLAGQASLNLKNFDAALAYYEKILKLDPRRVVLYKNIADIYYLQGRWDKAVELNQRGLMLNPADYHWPLQLSLLYREKKDLAAAKKYLSQALKLAPENQELKKYEQELNK